MAKKTGYLIRLFLYFDLNIDMKPNLHGNENKINLELSLTDRRADPN